MSSFSMSMTMSGLSLNEPSSMTMASMTNMKMGTSTASAAVAAATSSGMSGMGGMNGGNSCKISMLWNWYTVDACFLSSQWHITSGGMMAGSCVGVVCLVMALEALRRAAREFDAHITRQALATISAEAQPLTPADASTAHDGDSDRKNPLTACDGSMPGRKVHTSTPNLVQQLVRALLHMLQFAVAYIIMLLAMYFNGYIIICIFIGAFLGAFIFNWRTLSLPGESREITFCCG